MKRKWADFCISAKRSGADGAVASLQCRPDYGDSMGMACVLSPALVIAMIEDPHEPRTFVTTYRSPGGQYRYGAPVFVRTDASGRRLSTLARPLDAFADLPEF